MIDDADEFNKLGDSRESEEGKVRARLSTECRMSGITVSINFASPTSGTIYIKVLIGSIVIQLFVSGPLL